MSNLVVFDLETIPRPIPDEIKKGVMAGIVKVDKVTKEPAKIAEKLKAKWWSTPEGAKPIAAGFAILNSDTRTVEAIQGLQTEDEGEMAQYLLATLQTLRPRKLIGYNSSRFDNPILRYMVRNLGNHLVGGLGKWDHIDLADKVDDFLSASRPLKGSPISACALYGIDHSGTKGGDVAAMLAKDKEEGTEEVLKYCLEDVVATGELFWKLSILDNLL